MILLDGLAATITMADYYHRLIDGQLFCLLDVLGIEIVGCRVRQRFCATDSRLAGRRVSAFNCGHIHYR